MSNNNNAVQDVTEAAALLSDLKAEFLAAEALSRELKLSGKAAGPKTGFTRLDNEMNGFLAPGLHTMLAAPGAGKTAFALQIAAQCGCPALYVTAEMGRLDLMRRVIARASREFLSKFSGGTLSEAVLLGHLLQMEAAAPMLSILDATATPATPPKIIQSAEALKKKFDSEHVLIIVDSVTDWANGIASLIPGSSTEYQIMETALTSLKQMSALIPCPIIGIAHKNRNSQNGSAESSLFSGKGTGRFEYVSESLWSLDPTEEKSNAMGDSKEVILTLAKNRHGAKGAKVHFKFEGRLMEFREGMGA